MVAFFLIRPVKLQQYSYQYNIKIIGLPSQDERESAVETSSLCVDLFISMGVHVSINDIDIALRVSSKRKDERPNSIINPSVRIFEHLTPKNQQILFEARAFKDRKTYQYCWSKNGAVYLSKTAI